VKITWFCADRVGLTMAGPAIRAVELSRRLARAHGVTLVASGASTLGPEPFHAVEPTPGALASACRGADVLVTQGFGFSLPIALRFPGRLVLDLYDPVQLEQLARIGPAPTADQRLSLGHVRARLRAVLARADHVLCASAAQRMLWLGWMGAAGRLTPEVLAGDPEARRLLAIVPFGTPAEPPARAGTPLRDAVGAAPGEKVALFWGGLWDWMDPALAVRAAAHALEARANLHLAFIAGARPGATDAMRHAPEAARAAARDLGVASRVHFLDRWVPYAERGAWLLDADLAITAHQPSLETAFAFRTRLLDCLWARLPVAATRGDVLADEAEREGFGVCASPGDAQGLGRAVLQLLEPEANACARAAAARVAGRYTWDGAARTLLALLEEPAPPRPPLGLPGELAGGSALAVARALAGKIGGRLGVRR
jgi:glycosyltransferase involved in cell wall biosynthesis